jgi:hypothetical protein
MSTINISTATLPDGFCPTDFRSGWHEAVSFLTASFSGTLNTINFGSTTPTPENRDKPWYRTETNGAPDTWYVFWNGYWVAKHPVAVGTITLYTGTAASIDTFDGGEAGTVTDISGPFWERVTALDAKFPVGIGTLPSAKVLNPGDTGGEEKHELTLLEMPRHRHDLPVRTEATDNPNQSASFPIYSNDWTGAEILRPTRAEGGDEDFTTNAKNAAHNNLPPYFSLLFLRRTARIFRRI